MVIHDKDIYYKFKTHYFKIFKTWMRGSISVMSTPTSTGISYGYPMDIL
jgi:hypothetical protein